MILGLGTDLVELLAFGQQLDDAASSFIEGTFTPQELRIVRGRPARDKTPHLAGRFAAKEAFIKAWSASRFGQPPKLAHLDLRQIEVIEDGFGRPAIQLAPELQALLPPGSRLHVSISHDGRFATATVILEGD